ncbi:MAG: lipopolysaccharide biosynthesis protein, partial [Acidobacteria bacterium]|nr:lipopolysaccharide biosynthesis protein [Acidobacteriota bacterium]
MKKVQPDEPLINGVNEPAVYDEQDFAEPRPSRSNWATAALLWQQRRLLLRAAMVAAVLAAIISLFIPNRYTARTRIMPPESSQNGMAMLAALAGKAMPGLAGLATDVVGGKNSGALFVGLLQSRTVQDRLVDRFDLRKVYWDRYWEDARDDLHKRTDVGEDRKSGIITIEVTDRDPRRAAAMANAYVEELDHLVAQVSTSSARQERLFIEQRLEGMKQDLERAEKNFSEFASKNTALDIKEQTRAMVGSAAQLQGQLMVAQSELEGLKQVYTSSNIRVRSAAARVAELQKQLKNLGGSDDASASADELYPSIRKLPLLGVEWANLYREAKVQETVYELLTQKYELARIEEAKEIPVVKVADRPVVPEKKSFPPRLLIIALSALGAVILGSVWIVYSREWQQIDIQDPRKILVTEIHQSAQGAVTRFASVLGRNGHNGNAPYE